MSVHHLLQFSQQCHDVKQNEILRAMAYREKAAIHHLA